MGENLIGCGIAQNRLNELHRRMEIGTIAYEAVDSISKWQAKFVLQLHDQESLQAAALHLRRADINSPHIAVIEALLLSSPVQDRDVQEAKSHFSRLLVSTFVFIDAALKH